MSDISMTSDNHQIENENSLNSDAESASKIPLYIFLNEILVIEIFSYQIIFINSYFSFCVQSRKWRVKFQKTNE